MKGTVDKLLNFMKLTEDEEYDEEYEEYEDEEEEEPEKVGFSFFKKKEKEPVEESEEEVSQPFDHVLSREEKKKRFTSTRSLRYQTTGFCRSADSGRSFKERKNCCDQFRRCGTYSCTKKY